MLPALLAVLAALAAPSRAPAPPPAPAPCAPTEPMKAIVQAMGEGWRFPAKEDWPEGVRDRITEETGPTVCVRLEEEDRVSLCTILVGTGLAWRAGCFFAGAGSDQALRFEPLPGIEGTAEAPVHLQSYLLTPAPKGTITAWAGGAANISLERDCVGIEEEGTTSRLMCWTGTKFASLPMAE